MKIIDYKIVSCCSTEDLTIRIKENLAEGWQPFGRIAVVSEGKHPFFDLVLLQTLVKYKINFDECTHEFKAVCPIHKEGEICLNCQMVAICHKCGWSNT